MLGSLGRVTRAATSSPANCRRGGLSTTSGGGRLCSELCAHCEGGCACIRFKMQQQPVALCYGAKWLWSKELAEDQEIRFLPKEARDFVSHTGTVLLRSGNLQLASIAFLGPDQIEQLKVACEAASGRHLLGG